MIFNVGGGIPYEVPVLNSAYPADVSVMEGANASATFQVQIATHGYPEEYRYKWYKSNSNTAIPGATGASCTISGLTAAATYSVYCVVTSDAGEVTSRVATLTVTSAKPVYSYTGAHQLVDDGNYDWRLKLLTSGVLTFSS